MSSSETVLRDDQVDWGTTGTIRLVDSTCNHRALGAEGERDEGQIMYLTHTVYPTPPPLPLQITWRTRSNTTEGGTEGSTGNVLWDASVYFVRYLLGNVEERGMVEGR